MNQEDLEKEQLTAKRKLYYQKNREKIHEKNIAYYRAFEPYKLRLWRTIPYRVKYSPVYKNRKLFFSRDEFLAFVEKNIETYKKLYEAWQESGFQRKFAPSVDRVDNDGDYTLDNIELVSMNENTLHMHRYYKAKGYSSRKYKPHRSKFPCISPRVRSRPTFGVTFHKQSGKWQAQMSNKYIGIFATQEEARSALNKYLLFIKRL